MSSTNVQLPFEQSRPSTSDQISNTMMLPPMLRHRNSSTSGGDMKKEKPTRTGSVAEPERRSSLSALPMRLRRRKTQPATGPTEVDQEAADRLGRIFFTLPSEIIGQVVTNLTINDIFNLRLTSRLFNDILNYNANSIIHAVLPQCLTPTTTSYIQPTLYPTPTPTPNLSHLLTMLRRQYAVDRQIYNLLAFVQMKIYMTRSTTRVFSVTENRQRLIEAFQRPAWFVTHFLEQYRDILIYQHPSHETTPNCSSCHLCKAVARRVVAAYPIDDVMPAYHFYQLAIEHLQLATRTPMSAGPLERRLRGWQKGAVTEEGLAIFVILGGVPELRKVAMMQGSYNSRVAFLTEFVVKVRQAVSVNNILAGVSQESSGPQETLRSASVSTTATRKQSVGAGVSDDLASSLSPRFEDLKQEHITSLPEISRFFYDVWKDRIQSCNPDEQDIQEPYPWLQRIMSASGLEFGLLGTPSSPVVLGAAPT